MHSFAFNFELIFSLDSNLMDLLLFSIAGLLAKYLSTKKHLIQTNISVIFRDINTL